LEEEELVDQKALSQAKMIRAKARQVALRNQQVAQVYLQRLTQMIDAEDAEYSRQQRMLLPAPSSSTTTTTTTNSSPLDGKQAKMNSLRTHLTQLQQQLNELQVHLWTQREELQSTVDTINVYLEKQREEKEGGDSTKGSRDIENTITSRDNEGQPRWKSAVTTTVMGNNTLVSNAKPLWKEKSAEMRLAHFLTNYP
jgi:chromosome segregation ATPase